MSKPPIHRRRRNSPTKPRRITVRICWFILQVRDWTDVRDVVRLFAKIDAHPQHETFEVLNGGSGRGTTVAEIAGMLVENWGDEIFVRYSGSVRAGDPFSLLADDARLRGLPFDWQIPIGQGLADYVRWFKGQVR